LLVTELYSICFIDAGSLGILLPIKGDSWDIKGLS
jgi:hypothetical protein